MLFCGFDRRMTKQQLNGSEILPSTQERDGESVAKAMGMPINVGELKHAVDCSPGTPSSGGQLAFAGPKEIRGLNLELRQGAHGISVQRTIKRHARFHHPSQQPAGTHVQATSFQFYDIRDAQTGIQKREYKCLGAEARALRRGPKIVVDSFAGRQDSLHLVVLEGHGGLSRLFWWFKFFRIILRYPPSLDGERAEPAQVLEFFPLRRRGGAGAGTPICRENIKAHFEYRWQPSCAEGHETAECFFVAVDCRWGKLARSAIIQIGLNAIRELDRRRTLRFSLEPFNSSDSSRPVVRFQTAAKSFAVQISIAPDRAGALRIVLSSIPVPARLQVSSIGFKHANTLSEIGTPHGTREGEGRN
jgi:hypothetical protein